MTSKTPAFSKKIKIIPKKPPFSKTFFEQTNPILIPENRRNALQTKHLQQLNPEVPQKNKPKQTQFQNQRTTNYPLRTHLKNKPNLNKNLITS